MENTPKSLRLQLAICGRINAGKSTLLNLISGQNHAITSPERGTTTDVVEKVMELRPLGPVVLLDTAGVDDDSTLGIQRLQKTSAAIDRADAVILVTSPGSWSEAEEKIYSMTQERKIPLLPVINYHNAPADENFLEFLQKKSGIQPIQIQAADTAKREEFLDKFTNSLLNILPESRTTPAFLNDLVPAGSLVVMMTPIDTQAPKGRLIMPEVMAIRDALDGNAAVVVAKEDAFPEIYRKLNETPALAICDSQVVHRLIESTDEKIPKTTFSILMSRMKGDIELFAAGSAAIKGLKPGAKVLIAEACTHHAADNDIGKKQIPMLLEKYCGGKLDFTFYSGADFPDDLNSFELIVHCGGCMLNRRAMLNRLRIASAAGVPVTNYGMCISFCRGVLEKVLSPFPSALKRYVEKLDKN
ncbi:MAG: [FeFe] hydrogenase H-cluster maturation GTPase HydF [Lentisphaeria bacterium]|nr:[FeFe] hydrogenase H-cluster maturation GTPase HydF [Lentisphaeria bacterium]